MARKFSVAFAKRGHRDFLSLKPGALTLMSLVPVVSGAETTKSEIRVLRLFASFYGTVSGVPDPRSFSAANV